MCQIDRSGCSAIYRPLAFAHALLDSSLARSSSTSRLVVSSCHRRTDAPLGRLSGHRPASICRLVDVVAAGRVGGPQLRPTMGRAPPRGQRHGRSDIAQEARRKTLRFHRTAAIIEARSHVRPRDQNRGRRPAVPVRVRPKTSLPRPMCLASLWHAKHILLLWGKGSGEGVIGRTLIRT